ncbi:post-GPI attachment to proteins factor 2 isoform X2 [Nematostella vectensis]|uniref:post-GPI attachment to proteins factor 2 isoform X2 n=1 Tax=Nematostella vectensis TaxID=45351 RepID=UPI0020772109|nr:post-GPI attachment to proteins factor 2 isoform X2 [Nematostella vectensis]
MNMVSEPFFEVRGSSVIALACALPFGSFVICILLSIFLHWDQVTKTHCNVPNYVPSISAATGDFSPEKYIWRIGIAYHSLLRMVFPFVNYNFYKYKASSNIKSVHEASFITFQVSAMVYMLTNCIIFRWTLSSPPTHQESVSMRWKVICLLLNYSSFAMAVYFFFRHNWYCESGVYSLFALCEYVTVLSNIGFHGTVAIDIGGSLLTLSSIARTFIKNH